MSEEDIFLGSLDLPDAAARAVYLDQACQGNAELRQAVERLLAAHFQSGEFLDVPAAAQIQIEVSAGDAVTIQNVDSPALHQAAAIKTEDDLDDLEFLAPSMRPDSLGRLGHYEVLQVLGKGGFGIVLRVFDDMLQRVVAIKVMAPSMAATSPARKRFLREARTSAQVRHENVVQVYEVGEQPLPYLVMEFIPGETLQQRLDRVGPLDVLETVRIGRQIAEGLTAAHAMDLIHRDIKPGNVLLEGSHSKVKITDFGLARAADDASMTQSGMIAGTPMYMAPEQALGKPLDHRLDLFSLGSVMYQMVSGRSPFRANNTVAVLKRVVEDQPRAIREVIPETPQWLCNIIAKLHEKNPDERYQSAREVADVLADCEAQLKENSRLRDFSRIPRTKAAASGKWKWVAAAAVVLPLLALALTELTGVTSLFRRQPIAAIAPQSNPISDAKFGPTTGGFVSLFNGKDLTGWKTHDTQAGSWHVVGGVLVGTGSERYLFSERGDYRDFHLRVEAKINDQSNSGVHFRSAIGPSLPDGYEAQINLGTDPWETGSLLVLPWKPDASILSHVKERLIESGTWFMLEVMAQGPRIIVKVDGKIVTDLTDERYRAGHLALQAGRYKTEIVQFRKIEIKELPASSPVLAIAPFDATKAKEHQDAWAKHLKIEPEITNSIGMKLRLIPPGRFVMGSSEAEIARNTLDADEFMKGMIRTEGPQRTVTLTEPFYLGAHEVTVGQFRQFVLDQGYKTRAETGNGGRRPNRTRGGFEHGADYIWSNPVEAPSADHPVVQISLPDVRAFCDWLGKREGRTYAVVNEEQWEYACRAGTTTRWYSGNTEDSLDSAAWLAISSRNKTQPVGTKQPNAFGLFDMLGNVEELCLARDGQVVLRGGNLHYRAVLARSATRLPVTTDYHNRIGFRVALVEFADRKFKDLRDVGTLRSLKSLKRINRQTAAEFWARYDGGI